MKSRFIPVAHPLFLGNEKAYVNECLDTEWVSSIGRFIPAFEEKFARFCDVEHAVSCSSGTTALHLALMALGVKEGDEVLVPALTYIATANAVRYCGASPVFVDSEPRTFNLDPARIEEKITPRTKGIVPVHLYGHPAEMDSVHQVARHHGLFVLEDAAEAHGALYKGRRTGSLGDLATFSFFGNKIITTGEGGMVVCRRADLAAQMRLLKGQGMEPERRYWFPIVGYNYRMTNIQAALGLAQLEKIDEHLAVRRRIAEGYRRRFESLQDFLTVPFESPAVRHAFWMYTVLLPPGVDRDAAATALHEDGVETRPAFYPLHLMPPYREPDGAYPEAEAIGRRGLSLPMHGKLSEGDLDYICGQLRGISLRAAGARK